MRLYKVSSFALLRACFTEGSFELAEGHLIYAGDRDSARLLAQMMSEWWLSSGSSATAGAFALRGTLPYVILPE